MTSSGNPRSFIHGHTFALPSPPKVGAVCLNRARTDLRRGRGVTCVPTAIRGDHGLGMELRNGSNFEVLTPFCWPESNILPAQMACGRGASRSRRPHVHVVKSCRWNLGDLIRVRLPLRTGP